MFYLGVLIHIKYFCNTEEAAAAQWRFHGLAMDPGEEEHPLTIPDEV